MLDWFTRGLTTPLAQLTLLDLIECAFAWSVALSVAWWAFKRAVDGVYRYREASRRWQELQRRERERQ